MTALVSQIAVRWYVPVRGDAPVTHLAPRTHVPPFGPVHGTEALCGAVGTTDRFARVKWRRTRSAGGVRCMTCFANACDAKGETRVAVDWG